VSPDPDAEPGHPVARARPDLARSRSGPRPTAYRRPHRPSGHELKISPGLTLPEAGRGAGGRRLRRATPRLNFLPAQWALDWAAPRSPWVSTRAPLLIPAPPGAPAIASPGAGFKRHWSSSPSRRRLGSQAPAPPALAGPLRQCSPTDHPTPHRCTSSYPNSPGKSPCRTRR